MKDFILRVIAMFGMLFLVTLALATWLIHWHLGLGVSLVTLAGIYVMMDDDDY